MTLQYKYESDGDIELLEADGIICFKRIGFNMEIKCDPSSLDDLIATIDKCRSNQPEVIGIKVSS